MNIENIIKGKIVGIMSHGASISKLEEKIDLLRDKDIVWCSFNYWDLMEDCILSKINKKLDIVLDCAMTINYHYGKFDNIRKYEKEIRIPNFIKLLNRGTLTITNRDLIKNKYGVLFNNEDFYKQYGNLFTYMEDLNIQYPEMPYNTLSRLLAITLIGKPKKIILFGLDGYMGENRGLETYYKPRLWLKRKELLDEVVMKPKFKHMLRDDTIDAQNNYLKYCKTVCEVHNINLPEIVNCNPNSIIDVFRKINYEELYDYVSI